MKSIRRICLGAAFISIALGIILVVLAMSIGGKDAVYSVDASYHYEDIVEQVSSIDVDVSYGSVKIVKGDEFKVTMNHIPENGYESYVKDGTWYIKDKEDDRYSIKLFGKNIRILSFDFLGVHVADYFPEVTIEFPEEFEGEKIQLSIGSGELDADAIRGNEVKLSVGAGSLEVGELIAKNSVFLDCGAGELIVKELDTKNAEVECGVGSISLSGTIKEDCYVDSGIGSVYLNLNGNEEDYNYSVDCGIGHVVINNDSYSGITDKTIRNNNAKGDFNLECGIGEIQLYIK